MLFGEKVVQFKVPLWSVETLHICNVWILMRKFVIYLTSAEKFIFMEFFVVKVDQSDVIPRI